MAVAALLCLLALALVTPALSTSTVFLLTAAMVSVVALAVGGRYFVNVHNSTGTQATLRVASHQAPHDPDEEEQRQG